jgi:putative oxidoreductase
MIKNPIQFNFFEKHREYGTFFLRLLIGIFIIYGVQDNVFSREHMQEFAVFLQQRGVPFPMFSAHLSAYAQLICGIMILFGAWIRLASIPFIINFIVAFLVAHRDDSFRGAFPALMMIAAGLFFLFNGAGKPSVDHFLGRRASGRDIS